MYKTYTVSEHTGEYFGQTKATLVDRFAPRNPDGSLKKPRWAEDLLDPHTSKELGIDENDLWIVSIAKEHNLVFVTNDGEQGMRRVIEAAKWEDRTQLWQF